MKAAVRSKYGSPDVLSIWTKFDAIVIGSGISGGWAAKELCEKGLKVLLLERGENVEHPNYFTATKNTWDFTNGTIYLVSPDASYRNIVTFQRQQLQLPKSPFELAAPDKNPDDMSASESMDYLEQIRLSGDNKKILSVAVKIQNKLALPFVCIVFSLIGSAMGIRPQRTGKATSFGVSVLMIFGYYLVMFVCGALGQPTS